jgi:hypothetical protein
VREPWDAVISPERIAGATVFRVEEASAPAAVGGKAAAVAQQFWRDALPFDHAFDLATPERLYCTELVWRAYMAARVDLRGGAFGSGRRYLLPSDLIESGLLREIQP